MAKTASVKATGLKHLIGGHYAAKVNGKQALVKLPHNVEKPADGSDIDVYPDWLADETPELSDVQKRYAAQATSKPVGGGNANAPEETSE